MITFKLTTLFLFRERCLYNYCLFFNGGHNIVDVIENGIDREGCFHFKFNIPEDERWSIFSKSEFVLKAVEMFKGNGNPDQAIISIISFISIESTFLKGMAETEEEKAEIEKQKKALFVELDRQLEAMNIPQIITIKRY